MLAEEREVGRYRILSRVAAGGMGEVYRARMVTMSGAEKLVALKVVRPDLAERSRFTELFVAEAKVAMTLSHANIVQSFDVGRIDDQWFIAMELVEGATLAHLGQTARRKGARLPLRLVLTAIIEALKGLDYAHRRKDANGQPLGLVHCDISPQNILVSNEGEVKVADFGVAKSRLTTDEGQVRGKLAYMPDEQLRGGGFDARADLYAMGMVLAELLTGRHPFSEESSRGPLELPSDLPLDLRRIVERAVALDPDARFSTAAQMRQALERFAFDSGLQLSTSDLADVVRETVLPEEGDLPEGSTTHSGLYSTDPADAKTPFREPGFGLRLGEELRRVAGTEVSVFMTRTALHQSVEVPNSGSRKGVFALGIFGALAALATIGWVAVTWGSGEGAPSVSAPEVEALEVEALETEAPTLESPASTARAPEPSAEPGESVVEVEPEPESSEAAPEVVPESASETAARAESSPRSHPRPTARGEEPGTLWVDSEPWAEVYIDGHRVGRTLFGPHSIEAGAHRLRLVNPAAGLEHRRSFRVASGQTVRIAVDLSSP
ncbi:MAG: protein kinase [Myxococcota bacterium]